MQRTGARASTANDRADLIGVSPGMFQRAPRSFEGYILQRPLCVKAALDSRLLDDLARRHWRPVVSGVAHEILVRALDLPLHDSQGFEPWLNSKLLAHVDCRKGAGGRLRCGGPGGWQRMAC